MYFVVPLFPVKGCGLRASPYQKTKRERILPVFEKKKKKKTVVGGGLSTYPTKNIVHVSACFVLLAMEAFFFFFESFEDGGLTDLGARRTRKH